MYSICITKVPPTSETWCRIDNIDPAAITSTMFQNSSPLSIMYTQERTSNNSIGLKDIHFSSFVRLVNMVIHVLHIVAQTTPYPPWTCELLLVDARHFLPIGFAILMSTINRGKVIQLRDRITTNCLAPFPPIRRAHLAVFVLHPHCISATHHG